MNKRKWLGVGLAITMFSTLAVGCGDKKEETQKDAAASPAKDEQVLNLTLSDEIPTLDASKGTDSITFTILGQINEGLTRLDEKGKVVPGVAKEWKVSPDGLTYTFTLRDDAKWSDGSNVTAHDFEYAWKRTLDPKTKSGYAFIVAWVKGGAAYNEGKGTADQVMVKAKDDKTLEVVLETPKPYFLEMMTFPVFFPQKKEFVEKQGDSYGGDADKMLYNGPFKLSSWVHEQSAELVKNDAYWDKGAVKLDKVNFQVVKDSGAKENLYLAGQVDRISLVREQTDTFKDSPEFSRRADLATGYIMFNEKHKIFKNAKVRKALTYAIDGEKYADVVFHDGSTGATAYVPNGTSDGAGGEFRKDGGDLIKQKENFSKAKALLEEGLKEAGETSFPKMKLLMSDTTSSKKGAEFVKEEWRKNLGIDVEIETVPFKLRLKRTTDRDYDIVFSNWIADYNDPMTFLDMWVTGGDQNKCDWSNPKYDELIKKAQVEVDGKKRAQLLHEAEKILMDEMPIGPIYFSQTSFVTRPYVKNWVSRSFGPEFDLKFTYIEGKK
jgi:oligopeptide transport system substrate-binding protein